MRGKTHHINPNQCQAEISQDYDLIWKRFLSGEHDQEYIDNRKHGRRFFYDTIKKHITEKKVENILELGCGTGIDLNILAQETRNVRSFGSDISPRSIEVCKKITATFHNQINFFVGDTRVLPLRDSAFDLVYSQGLVEHFSSPLAAVEEQARVLCPTGILVINVPQKYTGYTLMKKKRMREGRWELGWEMSFSYRDLRNIGLMLGLTEIEVFGYQYWKSWAEPTFVLRDLANKLERRTCLKSLKYFASLKRAYEKLWELIEKKWGHYFLQNIVIVFQKKQ